MITATEARELIRRSQTDENLERDIEQSIRTAIQIDAWPLTIAIKGLNRASLDRVLNRYRDCGWTIKLVDDSRDGDYVEFDRP